MNDYESGVSYEAFAKAAGKESLWGGIIATIHLLDGRTFEKEFRFVEFAQYVGIVSPERELLRVWMDHTKWIETGPNEFTPMSQVIKITWTEIPQQPSVP